MGTIFRFWLPLAASWLLMSTESPTVTAFIARMPEAKLQLAAFGVAISLALAVESPILSLLTAANALARDRQSFRLLYRFTMLLNVAITVFMLLLGLTPLFDLVVVRMMGTPPEIAVLVRPAVLALTLWGGAIGYRRFFQGVMIRYGHTRQISYGTLARLLTVLIISVIGFWWGKLNGATLGGLALGLGVVAEATYIHFLSREAVRQVQAEPPQEEKLDMRTLLQFYTPLTLTALINLSTTPLLNLGMNRAAYPIESLAVWPVINGQLFLTRSFGYSLQEVVVALLHRPSGKSRLRRFAVYIGLWSFFLISILALTPVGPWWQKNVAGLDPELTGFTLPVLKLVILLPVLAVVQSWLRGVVVVGKKTVAVAQATVINLVVLAAVLWIGTQWTSVMGASLSAIALTMSQGIEAIWLWRNARRVEKQNREPCAVPCTNG